MATINMAAMNIVEHVSLLYVGTYFRDMSRSTIAGSSDSAISNFLRNHQIDLQSDCISIQSH